MSVTTGVLPQYQVQMCLSSNPATYTTLSGVLVAAQIRRGRSDEQGGMQAGTCTLTLDNATGAFSPDNPSSPYTGYLVPGRKVQILARFDVATAWNPLFTGYIDSIRPVDNGPLDANVVIQCVDWLGLIANRVLNGTATAAVGVHDLVNWFASLMGIVDSGATYTIVNPTDGTSQHLSDYPMVNASAPSVLTDFGTAVHGVVFAGADGTVRATANGGTATTTLFDTLFVLDQQGVNPAANVVPYVSMDYDLTTQYLYNDITVTATATGEGPQNAQDAASIAAYGDRALTISSAIMGPGQAAPLANTLMLAYRNPKPRVHALVIDIDGTTALTQGGHTAADLLFGLELTAPVTVAKQNPGSLGISRAMVVEGITHDIRPDLGGHTLSLQLTEKTNIAPTVWTLGTSKLGTETVLGYGVQPFNPTSIAGLTLYLRSDLGVARSGTSVDQWFDQSGNGHTATGSGAARPTLLGGQQAGKPAIVFNASLMTFSTGFLPQNWSIFVVGSINVAIVGKLLFARDGTATNYRGMDIGGGAGSIRARASDGTNSVTTAVSGFFVGPTYIWSGTSAAGNPAISYYNNLAGNSVTATPAAPIADFTPTNWDLGGFNGVGDATKLSLYAVLVFDHVLSPTDRAYILNGLNTIYLTY